VCVVMKKKRKKRKKKKEKKDEETKKNKQEFYEWKCCDISRFSFGDSLSTASVHKIQKVHKIPCRRWPHSFFLQE
jgi:hypothetical protein